MWTATGRCVVRDSNSGHQLLFPHANWCPIFASWTTQVLMHMGAMTTIGQMGQQVGPHSGGRRPKEMMRMQPCSLYLHVIS